MPVSTEASRPTEGGEQHESRVTPDDPARPRLPDPRPLLALLALAAAGTLVVLALIVSGRIPLDEDPARAPGLRGAMLPAALRLAPAPRIRLTDTHGGSLDTRGLAGRPYLVTFLYTRCPDACPLIGQEIRQALDALGGARADDVAAIAVSVDPEGDTTPAVREWIDRQGLPPDFHYLIGARPDLLKVWRDWYVVPQDDPGLDVGTHTASVWLVDARGRLRTKYSGGAPIDPDDLTHDLRVLLAERKSPENNDPEKGRKQ